MLYMSSNAYNSTPSWRIYENTGGAFALHANEANPLVISPAGVSDFNLDGKPDILTTSAATRIILNQGGLDLSLANADTVAQGMARVHVGDINGDGTQDIFQAHTYNGTDWISHVFVTRLNNGEAQFDSSYGNFILAVIPANKLSDIDNDGDLDYLYIKPNGQIFYAQNIDCSLVCSSTDDFMPGSLRYVVDCARDGDTISFSSLLAGDTIHLTSSLLVLDKELTIYVPDTITLFIQGNMSGLMLHITPEGNILLDGLDIILEGGSTLSQLLNEGTLSLKDLDIYAYDIDPEMAELIKNLGNLNIYGSVNVYKME